MLLIPLTTLVAIGKVTLVAPCGIVTLGGRVRILPPPPPPLLREITAPPELRGKLLTEMVP